MDVLFLDANILFSVAYKADSRLVQLWELSDVELVTSAYAVDEARRNLRGDDRLRRLDQRLRSVRIVPEVPEGGSSGPRLPREVTLPDDDLPILQAAIAARATHLVTGDFRDFGPLYGRQIGGVRILPPVEYLRSRSR